MSTIHFSIDGEYLTRLARNLVIEEEWKKAVNILKEGICGVGYDIIFSVLNGNQKFIGINDLELVEDDDVEYKNYLRRNFSGLVDYKNSMWRPYAYVVANCKHDIATEMLQKNKHNRYYGPKIPEKYDGHFQEWSIARSTYYMNDKKNDLAVSLNYKNDDRQEVYVLWEKVEAPFWLENSTRDFQKGLDDFCKYGKLEGRVCSACQNDKYAETLYAEQPGDAPAKFLEGYIVESKRKHKEKLKQEELVVEKYERDIVKRMSEHSLNTHFGWLSPQGILMPCQYMEHCSIAQVIAEYEYGYGKDGFETPIQADDLMFKKGWIKLEKMKWHFENNISPLVTQSQFDTICEYAEKYELKIPEVNIR